MKIPFRSLLIFVLVLFVQRLFGHFPNVHEQITFNAAESAIDLSPAYVGFLNTIASDEFLEKNVTNNMMRGSNFEDNETPPKDIGKYRSLNHFYDPLDTKYGKGLSDWPPDFRVVQATNSFIWGAISNSHGLNKITIAYINTNSTNEYSWQNARGFEWHGLTAPTRSERKIALGLMYRAAGQVMHLLEDDSQPQHVRNEQHVNPWDNPDTFKSGLDPWNSPIEKYGYDNIMNLKFEHGMLNWRAAGFTKLEDFWDRHLYNGNSVKLDAETNGGTNALGLAEWCNGNFLGVRHTYAESFNKGDIEYYPFPSLAYTTQKQINPHNFAGAVIDGISLPNQKLGNRVYISKTGAGIPIIHHSALNYLAAQNTPRMGGPQMHITLTIDDTNVLQEYHDKLIPKAVEYSAGLLDYYFRGTLGVSVTGDGLDNYTITVTNTSGQDFGGGSLYLFKDDESGNRNLVQQTDLSNTILPTNGTVNMTLSSPGTNKCFLVYQGTIGVTNGTNALDPVDAGIGIAATSVSFSPSGIIRSEEPVRWYLSIASTFDGGEPWVERLVSTSSSFNGNNGDYSAPVYAYDQFICGFWCALPTRGVDYDVTVNFNDEAYLCVWDYWSGMLHSGDVYHVGANQSKSLWFGSPNGFNSVNADLIIYP